MEDGEARYPQTFSKTHRGTNGLKGNGIVRGKLQNKGAGGG